MICWQCNKEIDVELPIGRKDTCPFCGSDLRCCKQCIFYDPSAYNECREVSAERIVDKERANFCDYFSPKVEDAKPISSSRVEDAKKALERLFKK